MKAKALGKFAISLVVHNIIANSIYHLFKNSNTINSNSTRLGTELRLVIRTELRLTRLRTEVTDYKSIRQFAIQCENESFVKGFKTLKVLFF